MDSLFLLLLLALQTAAEMLKSLPSFSFQASPGCRNLVLGISYTCGLPNISAVLNLRLELLHLPQLVLHPQTNFG